MLIEKKTSVRNNFCNRRKVLREIREKDMSTLDMWLQEKDNGDIHINASAGSIASCSTLLQPLQPSQLKRITNVDLSFNSLKNIDGLQVLTNMKSLDIRCNNIPSLHMLLPVLQKCHGLKHLRMKVCGRFARDPKMYLHDVCREVPALLSVDGLKSTSLLSEQQQRARAQGARAHAPKPGPSPGAGRRRPRRFRLGGR